MNVAIRVLLAVFAASLLVTSARANPLAALVYIRVGVTDPITKAEKDLMQGSGFLIDMEGHIITAKHVVRAQEKEHPGPGRWIRVAIRDRGGALVPAQEIACDDGSVDLCLIRIQKASVEAANIKAVFKTVCRQLGQEDIRALGFPPGQHNPATSVPGVITGALATESKYPSNVDITPGMSGGPVLDKTGNVVAVNAGAATGLQNLTFLQPLFYGRQLIERTGAQCPAGPPPASAPAPVADEPPQPPEFRGVRIVYFERSADQNKIVTAFEQRKIQFNRLKSDHDIPVNIMVCGPTTPISAIKSMARILIEAGVKLRVIKDQDSTYDAAHPSRLSIESDYGPAIEEAPVISAAHIDAMTSCAANDNYRPPWSISITNKCLSADPMRIYTAYEKNGIKIAGPFYAEYNIPATVLTATGQRSRFWYYADSESFAFEHVKVGSNSRYFNIPNVGSRAFMFTSANAITIVCKG
jgi:hypothetical protein